MDRRGGCCIAKYGGGFGYSISGVDRIMMKFRPIAPKPTNGTSGSSPEMKQTSPRSGRGRRRLNGSNNRRCNNGSNNRKKKVANEEIPAAAVVTLPLLPETPTPKKESQAGDAISPKQSKNLPTWLSFGSGGPDEMTVDRTVMVMPQVVIGSFVTVECLTDTWMDGDELGCTDRERRMYMERDKCPWFISDGFGRVTWTNEEYKKMARGDGGCGDGGEVVVWLTMKDKAAAAAAAVLAKSKAFTCRVRVQNQKEKSSVITVPCDVWRMDGGGFAWRLDITAALSLGR